MKIKTAIRKIHLVLGLGSGLIIVFLGLTGCILAFQKEIEHATQDYRFVKAEERAFIKPTTLQAKAQVLLPGKHLHSVYYAGKDNAAEARFFGNEPEFHYYIVYFNPYSGEVLKVKNMMRDFFYQVIQGHYYLWLPPTIGQPIVASATLIFFVMLVTGIILWWPRNKGAARQRFKIRWSARWRRKNYDLHSVLGFYASWVAIILALTGLVFGFQWFSKLVYTTAGGSKSLTYEEPVSTAPLQPSTSTAFRMDSLFYAVKNAVSTGTSVEVHVPGSPTSPMELAVNTDPDTYWKTDYRFFDQYSMKELSVGHIYGRIKDANAADLMIKMNYDIHTGAIAGLAGKFLMFCASLIATSLPITGLYIYLGRRKKKKREQVVHLESKNEYSRV